MGNKKEYILCSAIRRIEPREEELYYNNDINLIEIGYRHHDILNRFKNVVSRKLNDQGFYTSKGRFVDRVTAMQIAYVSGQVSKDVALRGNKEWNQLFSEDLY